MQTLKAARMAAALVSAARLNEAIDAASQAESIAPIIDPTLYREKGQALSQDIQLLRAAAAFKSAIATILLDGLARGLGGDSCL